LLQKRLSFSQPGAYTAMAMRIATNLPEITRAYVAENPSSPIAKHRQLYEDALSNKTANEAMPIILWSKGSFIDSCGGTRTFNPEAKRFLAYVLKKHHLTLLKGIWKIGSNNTYMFLIHPDCQDAFFPSKDLVVRQTAKYLPHQIKQAERSARCSGNMPVKNLINFYKFSYYMSNTIVLLFFIFSCFFTRIRKSNYFSFALFALIVISINAVIMPNLSDLCGRYQARIMLLPALAASLIISDNPFKKKES